MHIGGNGVGTRGFQDGRTRYRKLAPRMRFGRCSWKRFQAADAGGVRRADERSWSCTVTVQGNVRLGEGCGRGALRRRAVCVREVTKAGHHDGDGGVHNVAADLVRDLLWAGGGVRGFVEMEDQSQHLLLVADAGGRGPVAVRPNEESVHVGQGGRHDVRGRARPDCGSRRRHLPQLLRLQ